MACTGPQTSACDPGSNFLSLHELLRPPAYVICWHLLLTVYHETVREIPWPRLNFLLIWYGPFLLILQRTSNLISVFGLTYCYAAYVCGCLSTFRYSHLVPSSKVKQSKPDSWRWKLIYTAEKAWNLSTLINWNGDLYSWTWNWQFHNSCMTPRKEHLTYKNIVLYCSYAFRRHLRHFQGAVSNVHTWASCKNSLVKMHRTKRQNGNCGFSPGNWTCGWSSNPFI